MGLCRMWYHMTTPDDLQRPKEAGACSHFVSPVLCTGHHTVETHNPFTRFNQPAQLQFHGPGEPCQSPRDPVSGIFRKRTLWKIGNRDPWREYGGPVYAWTGGAGKKSECEKCKTRLPQQKYDADNAKYDKRKRDREDDQKRGQGQSGKKARFTGSQEDPKDGSFDPIRHVK